MTKSTVDVVININKSLDWLKFCVDALIRNTDFDLINTIYLVDNHSGTETQAYLTKIAKKWHGLITVVHGKTDKVLKLADASYILLLDADCILSENAIAKMLSAMQADKKIGVICPISSVAGKLSYSIPDGMNFMQVNETLGEQFAGMTFDAPATPSHCLMFSRENLQKADLPDYLATGFHAKVLIDTYVYHKYPTADTESTSEPVEYIKKHANYKKVKNLCQLVVTDIVEFEKLAILINSLLFDHINVEMVSRPRIIRKYQGIMLFAPTIKHGFSLK